MIPDYNYFRTFMDKSKFMRTNYLFILLLLLCSFSLKSQIINIPDTNFKNRLLAADTSNGIARDQEGNYIVIDVNGNNEIEVSEALSVIDLYIDNRSIVSLEGIQYFTNLSLLDCSYNQIVSLDLIQNVNLQDIFGRNNVISNVIFPNFVNPVHINLSNNQLSQINLGTINQLVYLFLNNNNLTNLSFNNPNYTYLVDGVMDLSNNPLVSLDMSQLRNSDLNFGEPFDDIYINNTLLTQLVCPMAYVKYYFINNNPNLELISFQNQLMENFVENDFDTGLQISNNPNLSYICVDDIEGEFISEQEYFEGFLNNPNIIVSTAACNLGTQSNNLNSVFTLYPNPINSQFSIEYSEELEIKEIIITDMLGQLLLKFQKTELIEVSNLSSGTYFITLLTDKGMSTRQFIKN